MTALPVAAIQGAVVALKRDFPDWTVERYAGFPRESDSGQPSVYLGIDSGGVREERDPMTGATYADARITALMSWRISESDSWESAEDAAWRLFGWWRAQRIHPDSLPTYPLDIVMVEELDRSGRPLRSRALWHITASVTLILEEAESDEQIFGFAPIPDGVTVRDIWITDGDGLVTAGKSGEPDKITATGGGGNG